MPDINLLHDRETGERAREELAKQKQKNQLTVELTNPQKASQHEPTETPGMSFWSFLKDFFTRFRGPRVEKPSGPPRILHQERTPAKPTERPVQKSKTRITEHYVPPEKVQPPVEDIFAKPPSPPREDIPQPPRPGQERPAVPPTPDLSGGSFDGRVITPPQVTPPPAQPPPFPPREIPPAVPPSEQGPKMQEPGEPSGTFLGVNLVPEEMMSSLGTRNRVAMLGLVALIAILIIATGYVGMSIYESRVNNEAQSNRGQIEQIDAQLRRLNETKQKAVAFHTGTQTVLSLLDKHIYWTKFLSGLEKYTVDTVFYRSVSADQAGTVTLTASTSDFRSVSRQLLALEQAKDFIKTVSITSASARTEEGATFVDFSASITLVDGVFYRDSTGGPEYLYE